MSKKIKPEEDFMSIVEDLRDLLGISEALLKPEELKLIKKIFSNLDKLTEDSKVGVIIVTSLARMLEPLSEKPRYSKYIRDIVVYLLTSKVQSLKYAGLDLIDSGLNINPDNKFLLKEAKIILKDEQEGYVLDYLKSLT